MRTFHLYTVAVHAVGEDNEGNVAFAAASRDALEAKLVAWHNAAFADEPERFAPDFAFLDEEGGYEFAWGEDDVELDVE